MDKNDYIKIVNDYVNNDILNYALLIKGSWGCGKSYFVKDVLSQNINNKTMLIVSLFGVETRQEIEKALSSAFIEHRKTQKHILRKILIKQIRLIF